MPMDRKTKKHSSLETTLGELHVRNAGISQSQRRFLTTDNTAGGPRSMNVAGSLGAPVRFRFGPPAGQKWGVTNVVSAISDNANFNQIDFGAIPGGLTNGLALMLRSNGVDVDLYAGFRVKQNFDWFGIPAECSLTSWAGLSQTLAVDFNIFADSGQYVVLNGDTGDELVVIVQDDLTSLVAFRAVARYIVLGS